MAAHRDSVAGGPGARQAEAAARVVVVEVTTAVRGTTTRLLDLRETAGVRPVTHGVGSTKQT